MKQNLQSIGLLLFLVFILLSTSLTSARDLASKQGQANVKINNNISKKPVVEMKKIDSFGNLMGFEECEDEECLQRRVMAEAHLDYIYTQYHKP